MLRARRFLAAALLLAACGGRYASIDGGDGEGGSSSSGATTGSGGSGQGGKKPGGKAGTSAGGSVSTAGTSPAGGSISVGGKSTCGPCPDIDCGVGYTQQPGPDGCCNVCVPLD